MAVHACNTSIGGQRVRRSPRALWSVTLPQILSMVWRQVGRVVQEDTQYVALTLAWVQVGTHTHTLTNMYHTHNAYIYTQQ